jgi:hypothetical protein
MPLSKNEHRTLHDSIYVDLLDLRDKIKEQLNSGVDKGLIINTLNNSTRSIPAKAVRLMGKNN